MDKDGKSNVDSIVDGTLGLIHVAVYQSASGCVRGRSMRRWRRRRRRKRTTRKRREGVMTRRTRMRPERKQRLRDMLVLHVGAALSIDLGKAMLPFSNRNGGRSGQSQRYQARSCKLFMSVVSRILGIMIEVQESQVLFPTFLRVSPSS